jgi:lactam utilization protein B
MCSEDPSFAAAVAQAIFELAPGLPLLLLHERCKQAVENEGVNLVTEAFVDLARTEC